MYGTPVMRANPWLISPRLGFMRPLQRPALPPAGLGNVLGLTGPVQYAPLQGNNLPGPMPASYGDGQIVPPSMSAHQFEAIHHGFPTTPISAIVPPTPSVGLGTPHNAVVNPHPPPPPAPPGPAFEPFHRSYRDGSVGPKDWSPRSGRCGCRHKER
jgi:hypothetical protein